MAEVYYSDTERKKFQEFVESLKLVRKASLEDAVTGEPLIDKLYTDLLPNNGIIDKVNHASTTLLIGRKGTGKSTIFQKSINTIIQRDDTLCIYIDVKTLVDNTSLPSVYQSESIVISNDDIRRYLTYVEFLKIIITNTKDKINDKLSSQNLFNRVFGEDSIKLEKIIKKLETIKKNSSEVFKKIDITLLNYVKNVQEKSHDTTLNNEVTLQSNPSIKIGAQINAKSAIKQEFQNVIKTYLDIRGTLINNLIEIKKLLNLKYIYIYLDDFSEIDREGQEFFIDWFVAPLNNLSDDFIKFKIAAYPHRFYDGDLDPQKIDTVNLDFFDAFYTSEHNSTNISRMQELALDYTSRLLKGRFSHYFKDLNWKKFFSIEEKELYEILFDSSLNITRKIGFILSYCYESSVIHNIPISRESIKKAAERYYHDVTEKYFLSNAHIRRPFNDKISIENQNGLLKEIIDNSLDAKKSKKKLQSHFILNEEISYLLNNLNLQGYISIFNQIRDKNMRTLNVFALDYGLCVYNNIEYHKPITFSQQDLFDSNIASLVTKYFNNTQAIRCSENHEFEFDLLEKIKLFKMACPKCFENGKTNICEVYTTDKQLLLKLRQMEKVEQSNLVNYSEFLVMDYLFSRLNSLSSKNISENIDLAAKTVDNVIYGLIERELVEIDRSLSSRIIFKTFYRLTETGKNFITNILPNKI